ncbi:MAG TPA: hypothetical protein VJV21_02595 [Pyrinomonadaceae bacterium]|nr:hypothetical protein [Pyrinomonadaceae bacterium]
MGGIGMRLEDVAYITPQGPKSFATKALQSTSRSVDAIHVFIAIYLENTVDLLVE